MDNWSHQQFIRNVKQTFVTASDSQLQTFNTFLCNSICIYLYINETKTYINIFLIYVICMFPQSDHHLKFTK